MMKHSRVKALIFFTFLTIVSYKLKAQIYMGKVCEISFSAPTPIEDIAAITKIVKPLLNISTGDLQMKIPMTSFIFD